MRLLKLLIPRILPVPLIWLMLLAPPFGAARADAQVSALVAGDQLVVAGDGAANEITLRLFSLDAGRIQVLDGNTLVGTFTRSTFNSIVINGVGGNDTIVLSRIFGPITEPATINGGLGDDILSGGAGADALNGGSGADRIIWNPGDGSDAIDGGEGIDRLVVNGSAAAEVITVIEHPLSPGRVQLTRDLDAVTLAIGTTENLEVNALGGADVINALNLPAGLIEMTADGGEGDDELNGSIGVDILLGGDGNDRLRGGQGDDTIFAGAGDDEIRCCVSEDSDVVFGQTGFDRLTFSGQGVDEDVTITPDSGGIRFAIAARGITAILHDVEQIRVFTFEGDDRVTGADGLVANGLVSIIMDGGNGDDRLIGGDTNDELEGGPGDDQLHGGAGDDTLHAGVGATDILEGGPGNDLMIWSPILGNVTFLGGDGIDRLLVNGSSAAETFRVFGSGSFIFIDRVAPALKSLGGHAEIIELNTLGGDDLITVEGGLAALGTIEIDAGAGADRIETVASSVVIVNGSSEEDSLFFDALTQPVSVTPATIATGGLTRVTHTQVENVVFRQLLNPLPAISITSPTTDPATTATAPFFALAGAAADLDGIASITVTNDRGGSGTVTGTTAWAAANVPLAPGANVLTATVRDTSGNEASDTVTVTVNTFTYTLAEGSTGAFFDTDILIANPNTAAAPVSITYLKGDGTTVGQSLTLAPTSRTTIRVDDLTGLESTEVSATVTSLDALPIVVERTMRWDATGYGAHTEKATEGPSTTWFFAEGAQGFFDTYVLLANPGATANTATVTFLLENGAPVVKTFQVAPTSRFTVQANAIPEVVGRSFGIVVSFTQPGVAERAMYFGARQFDAGHESAGVNAPSTSWFLAEGATGSFFTTFVLLANPGTADAIATVTFLPESGVAVTKTKTVPAGQRVTLNIATEDTSLASGAIATAVQSTQPILVERAQYWPFTPDRWHEAHNAFGSTAIGSKWGLAEGRAGGPEGYQTYILLANADTARATQVRITFLRSDGGTVVRDFTVNPTSRLNVQAHTVPELAGQSFGALIEVTSGPGIFVERALYSDAQGVVFAAGTNALATRLP